MKDEERNRRDRDIERKEKREGESLVIRIGLQNHIDIYSASWGPEDDGKTFDGPGPLAREAFYRLD